MFAGGAFSEFGFCEHSYTPLDNSAMEAMLAETPAARCWLLALDAFSLATVGGVSSAFSDHGFGQVGFGDTVGQSSPGEVTLRFGTHGYTSQGADTPADTFHEPRVLAPPFVERSIAGRDGVGGLTVVYAEIRLNNRDGGLDLLARDYALDGRRATILVGRETDALAAFATVFTGVFELATVSEAEMVLRLSDGSARLARRMVNEAVYAGTGGLEGGADLKGKARPVALGKVFNAAPPLVDSARLIYQAHDGVLQDVPVVYDRQVVLTKGADYVSEADMNATAPSAGQYRVYKAGGYFRLGATPAGTVTADVEGDAQGGYVSTAAEIVQRLLGTRVELNSSEIDPTAFNQLALDAPAAVGWWCGTDKVSCAEVVDELLYGIGAFGGFSRHGAFTVGLVASPEGAAEDAAFDQVDILALEREPLPPTVEPIVWRVNVGWQRNFTVMDDVAASVTAARRTFAAQALRYASTEDAAIQSRHRLARELTIDAVYALEADAQAERDRQSALWSVRRGRFKVALPLKALTRDIGDVVNLTHPRHGFAEGRPARVLSQTVNGPRVELRVLA